MAEPETLLGREVAMEETRRSMFCKYHYKGVLIFVIPIVCSPLLCDKENKEVYRYLYILSVAILYFLFNVCPPGIIAFLMIILAPPLGVDNSKQLCISHYGDLIYQFITVAVIGMMMDGSKLSQSLGFTLLKISGGSIRVMQLVLMIITAILSLFIPTTLVAGMMMRVAIAALEELNAQGVFALHSSEEPYEYNSKPYPVWPAVGIYLTVAWTAVTGGFCSPLNGPNTYWYAMFKKYIPDTKLGFGNFYVAMGPVMILQLVIIYLWVQILFLGLIPLPMFSKIKENLKASSAASGDVREAVRTKSKEITFTFHMIMCILALVLGIILLLLRKPILFDGIDDVGKKEVCPSSLMVIVEACALMIPANLLFIRYCTCFAPSKVGPTSTLTSWKAINTNLPWNFLFCLAFGLGTVGAGNNSKFYKLMAATFTRSYKKGASIGKLRWYCTMYGTMTSMISPADALVRKVPHSLFKAGHNLGIGGGTLAIPFAMALHPAFMLPSGSGPTALVAGWGNLRTWQMFLAGIVPTLCGFLLVGLFFNVLAKSAFPGYQDMQHLNFTVMEATTKKK